MRIAFIVGRFPSVSETFVLNQITGVIDRGHEVVVFARKSDGRPVHADFEKYKLAEKTRYRITPSNVFKRLVKAAGVLATFGVRHPIVTLRSLNFFRYGLEATSFKLLFAAASVAAGGSVDFDVIHCHFGPNGMLGVQLREIGAIRGKLLTAFHGYDVNSFPRDHGKEVYRKLFASGDAYTANTNFTADKAAALGCPRGKITILPESLRVDLFPFAERKLAAGEGARLITVARLVEKKGLEVSIRAVAAIAGRHPSVSYAIIGDGHLRERLTALIGELGMSDKIQLLGWKTQEEVRYLYASSHIFVIASVTASDGDMEGQGLVLQEAQAMGLPVVSTIHNGIPDGVLDGKSGFLVAERDIEALAERLRWLVEHPEAWGGMGRAGREFVESRYDTGVLNDRVTVLYERLTGSSNDESNPNDEIRMTKRRGIDRS